MIIVDDSAVIRGIVTRWLAADPGIEVVASCANGAQALRLVAEKRCDVIVLDIEMPEMDGITALPQLIKAAPGVQIVMASTLTRRNADISMRALAMGAADYITKPESMRGATAADDFRRELIAKVKTLAAARHARDRMPPPARPVAVPSAARDSGFHPTVKLLPLSHTEPGILAIGSSTGGPQALMDVLRALGPVSIPIVITQHMPPTFTAILAEHLAQAAGRPCAEGRTGDVLLPGSIFVAPGGHHMEIMQDRQGHVCIALNDDPPVNFCKPAVDPLFQSVARIYGPKGLALVLTGMGSDGREGARAIVAARGTVVAQDEASSVVWGMPGAVAMAGLCSALWPLDRIGEQIKAILGGGSRAS